MRSGAAITALYTTVTCGFPHSGRIAGRVTGSECGSRPPPVEPLARAETMIGMSATQTALIVVVPEAEPVVGPWRATLDRAAAWGVPAHITVLYPFLHPDAVDGAVLRDLAAVVRTVPRFDVTLSHVDFFDDRVVWLAPRPQEPLLGLTRAVWRRFPQAPPYGGAFDDVVPHLTVGHDAGLPALRRAAAAVAAQLPVRAAVSSVRLIRGRDAPLSWHTVADLPLGAP